MIGISFHVGSDCRDASSYAEPIADARKLFDFAKTVGFEFSLLDIGGGFRGDKGTSSFMQEVRKWQTAWILPFNSSICVLTDLSIHDWNGFVQVAAVINESLDLHFPSPEVNVIAEPGRYFVASAFTLACCVHSKGKVCHDGKLTNIMYYLTDGIYGSMDLTDFKIFRPFTLKPPSAGISENPILSMSSNICQLTKILSRQRDSRVRCGVQRVIRATVWVFVVVEAIFSFVHSQMPG